MRWLKSLAVALMFVVSVSADNKTNVVTGVHPRAMTNIINSLILTNGISSSSSDIYNALSNLVKTIVNTQGSASLPLGSVVGITVISDVKANATVGGAFAEDTWITRTLNTIVTNGGGGITLAANVFTIPANVAVLIEASAPAYAVDFHKIRLYRTSGTPADVAYGTSEYSDNTDPQAQTRSQLVYYHAATGSATTYQLEHYCSTANGTDGLGRAHADVPNGDETYSVVKITVIDI